MNDKQNIKTESSSLQDGINCLMTDLSLVPIGIDDTIATFLETHNFDTLIHNKEISIKGVYYDFKLFLNEDMSAKLNLYIHIAEGHSGPFLRKIASTPNMVHGINRIIVSDHEYIFSVDIPPLTAETYKEQLEYYIKLLHDYELDLFIIL